MLKWVSPLLTSFPGCECHVSWPKRVCRYGLAGGSARRSCRESMIEGCLPSSPLCCPQDGTPPLPLLFWVPPGDTRTSQAVANHPAIPSRMHCVCAGHSVESSVRTLKPWCPNRRVLCRARTAAASKQRKKYRVLGRRVVPGAVRDSTLNDLEYSKSCRFVE